MAQLAYFTLAHPQHVAQDRVVVFAEPGSQPVDPSRRCGETRNQVLLKVYVPLARPIYVA